MKKNPFKNVLNYFQIKNILNYVQKRIKAIKALALQVKKSPRILLVWLKNAVKNALQFLLKLPARILRYLAKSALFFIRWLILTIMSWVIGVAVVIAGISWFVENKFSAVDKSFFQIEQVAKNTCDMGRHNILRIDSFSLAPLLAKKEIIPLNFDNRAPPIDWLDLQRKLQAASEDKRINAVLIDYNGLQSGRTGVAQLRLMLQDYQQKSGKPVYIFAQSLGTYHGVADYGLHDIADKIYLAPSGYSSLRHLGGEQFYLKRLFDELKIKPEFIRRHQYKSAPSRYTETAPSQAELDNGLTLLGDIEKIYRDMLQPRIDSDETGIFSASESLAKNLVDGIVYRDDLLNTLQSNSVIHRNAEWLSLDCYKSYDGHLFPHQNVQIINMNGVIAPEVSGQRSRGVDILTQIQRAEDDDDIAGLLVYVDSPGGDYAMSERIWHALYASEKPVAVLMGNVAASGGYFIAAGADKIFSYPHSITGSIGIFSGHFAMRGFITDILNIDPYFISTDDSNFSAFLDEYPPEYRAQMNKFIDALYDDFTDKVGLSRDIEYMDELARGRVFSGNAALQNGLIDGVGGLNDAIAFFEETLEDRVVLIPERENLGIPDMLGMFLGRVITPKITDLLYRMGIWQNGVRMQSDYQ